MSYQSNIKWINQFKIEGLESPLKSVAFSKTAKPKNAIIALHGFGDNAVNFSTLAQEIPVNDVLWVFPQGPKNYPMGPEGAQWYPLYTNPLEERRASEELIFQLFSNIVEQAQISCDKIFFLGFSQGASMAINCGIKIKEQIAGILSLSGFVIQACLLKKIYEKQSIQIPFFVAHGTQDQVILPTFFYESVDTLKDIGYKSIKTKLYQMGHSLCPEEISDIVKFVEEYR